jgi:ferric-dicitrate binding protein FerR (iron transport regulator)
MKLIFKKYLHSVLDPEEFPVLEDFLKNRKNDKEISSVMKSHWDLIMEGQREGSQEGSRPNPVLIEDLREALQADRQKRMQRKLKIYTWGLRAAAVLVLAIITGGVFYMRAKQDLLAQQWHAINTPLGAKTKIILPDSSAIWLNAGSSLKYSNEFGLKNREVHLSGEAFFEVVHDPDLLFAVRTSELTIRSYGTAFNVKSYPDEGTIETTLIEGSIGVTRSSKDSKKRDEVLLEPNQRVVFYRSSHTMETTQTAGKTEEADLPDTLEPSKQKTTYLISKGIETREYTSWKDGTIFISGESLEELAVKLERKYDVIIHFENEALKSLRFTGSLENETVEQVIQAIGFAAQIEYEIEDRDIWLKEQSK